MTGASNQIQHSSAHEQGWATPFCTLLRRLDHGKPFEAAVGVDARDEACDGFVPALPVQLRRHRAHRQTAAARGGVHDANQVGRWDYRKPVVRADKKDLGEIQVSKAKGKQLHHALFIHHLIVAKLGGPRTGYIYMGRVFKPFFVTFYRTI